MKHGDNLIQRLYLRTYGPNSHMDNWAELGAKIGLIVRGSPYTNRYIRSLANGDNGFKMSEGIASAVNELLAELGNRGLPEIIYEAGVVSMHNLPPGTLILGYARECHWDECRIIFVPYHPQQKYHCPECSRLARNKRARERRKNDKHGREGCA